VHLASPKAKYYQLLGLSPGASETEIKRAYRKLAMHYHPDKNPSPEAADRFIALTEAYEILTNQRPTPAASMPRRTSTTPVNPEELKKEQEERMRAARERYARKQAEEEFEDERYFQQISRGKPYRLFLRVMQICLLTSSLLFIDYFVPGKVEELTVLQYTSGNANRGFTTYQVIGIELSSSERLWVETAAFHSITKNPKVKLERSRLFGEVKQLVVRQEQTYMPVQLDFTLYSTFPLIPFLLLVPFIAWLIKSRSLTYSVLFHTTLYLYLPGVILFYLLNNRLGNLLRFDWF
jgi:hypothetical protein